MSDELTLGQLLDEVDAADKATSILEEQLRFANEHLQAARDALIRKMRTESTEVASNGNIKVSLAQGTRPQVIDWSAFYAFVLEQKAVHLFERRVAKKAYEEMVESLGKAVPGVTNFTYDRLTVRRS